MTFQGLSQLLPVSLPALARIGGIVACAPPFAGAVVPRRVRVMIAIALTIGLSPAAGASKLPDGILACVFALAGEAVIGVAIGLSLSFLFLAAQWTGEIITTQLGLNLGESFDPNFEGGGASLSQAYWLLTAIVFFAINGHQALVRGIQSSFQILPPLHALDSGTILDMLVKLLGSATSLAVRLAAPVFITMFIVDLAIGMVGRTMEQVGLMTVGITLRSIAGLIVLVLGMALATTLLQGAAVGWFSAIQSALSGR